MRCGLRWVALVAPIGLIACQPHAQPTPPPADAPAAMAALTGASVIYAAGDIGNCESNGDEQTAAMVDSLLKADSAAKVSDAVLTLGDNAYPDGSALDFVRCFTPSWGDSTKSIMKNIHPSPGNHEHLSGMAAPYYSYFGSKAGSPSKGYYSFDLGDWHIISLNSEMLVNPSFSQKEKDDQLAWLDNDLKSNKRTCSLAYWHHPRWSTGWHGNAALLDVFWQRLYNDSVDVIINGHDHDYERFAPLSPSGVVDSARGMPEFIVGTGGGLLRSFTSRSGTSAFRSEGHFGILKMTLGSKEFQWAFLDVDGHIWDPGAGKCH